MDFFVCEVADLIDLTAVIIFLMIFTLVIIVVDVCSTIKMPFKN